MLPVSQACPPPGKGRCDKVPRPDGSTVVLSEYSAVHYRADGTAADVTDVGKVYPDDAPELGLPAGPGGPPFGDGPTFDDRELLARWSPIRASPPVGGAGAGRGPGGHARCRWRSPVPRGKRAD